MLVIIDHLYGLPVKCRTNFTGMPYVMYKWISNHKSDARATQIMLRAKL